MLSDAKFHHENHVFSSMSSNNLLDTFLPRMSPFEDDDLVMDIGCGSGGNTKDVILRRIPKLKEMIAFDIIPEMIDFARLHFADEKIEYHVADIEDKSSLQEWEGKMSKIISVHCFHFMKDQRRAFQCLYNLLRPKGEAAFIFILSVSMWDCYPSLINNVKWSKYIKDVDQYVPESHHLHLGGDYFKNIFDELGFEVLFCEEESTVYRPDATTLKNDFQVFSALIKHIPVEQRKEFAEDFYSELLKQKPDTEDKPVFNFRCLKVHLRKP